MGVCALTSLALFMIEFSVNSTTGRPRDFVNDFCLSRPAQKRDEREQSVWKLFIHQGRCHPPGARTKYTLHFLFFSIVFQ
jgi:hypothetical protein